AQHHGLAVADDLLAVLRQVRQHAAAGAGGDDDVLAFHHLLLAVRSGHLDLPTGHQHAGAHDHVDLVLLHEELHAVAHALGHVAAPLHHGLHVGGAAAHGDAVVLGVVDVLEHLRAL